MKVLLGVTGSVAAKLTIKLVTKLLAAGHEVIVVATQPSLYFWQPADLPVEIKERVKVFTDEDEWPGEKYVKDAPILHVELAKWADILLIAPLTKNTLFKIAYGAADNLLTSIVAAWYPLEDEDEEFSKPLVIAPAMNTRMWLNLTTMEQIQRLQDNYDYLTVVEPVSRQLACGDVGVGALANLDDIIQAVNEAW